MSQLYSSTSQAAANTAAVAAAISARATRVHADLTALAEIERTRPLTREEQDRADWLRWLSNRLTLELATLSRELASLSRQSSSLAPDATAGAAVTASAPTAARHAA